MRAESILPLGWCCTSLEKIASWGSGGTPSRNVARYFQGSIPWIKTGELENKFIREAEEHITEEALNNSSAKIFPKGSVGIAMYGATIGKLSIWGIDASTNQACAVGIPSKVINNEFLYYFLLAERQNLIKAGKGGAQPNLSQGVIKEWPISLPPLPEQHRIVAKIEELFSELDKGIENLKTARAQLKVYRQALLKHAFEGKLTAQWRAENQDKLETADALLKRIQQERAQRYQQQFADWENSKSPSAPSQALPLLQRGKTISAATSSSPPLKKGGRGDLKPKAPKSLPPLTAEELAELPELPEEWGWVRLDEVSEKITDGDHQAPPQTTEGIPFITISDIKNQRIDFSDTRYVSKSYFDGLSEMRKPVKDDILYTVTGSFGIPCLIDFERDFCFQRHIGLIRSCKSISNKFLFYVLSSRHVYGQAASVATGTAQKTVPLGGLRMFKIPLTSLEEQQQIASELEARLSEADQLELTITTSLQQAEALRQSILKKAFSGQLVPQDPHDEPASKLLARIKAEKMLHTHESKKPISRSKRNE